MKFVVFVISAYYTKWILILDRWGELVNYSAA